MNRKNNKRKQNTRQVNPRVPKKNLGLTMYKSPRAVMPSEFDTNLKYLVLDTVTNVAGFAASIRFGTSAYDVDPALGSTAMPGFTEFAAFYKKCRPLRISYKFSAANSEAFNVTVIHGFSTTVVASGSLGIGYAGNPLMKTSTLGPLTGRGLGIYSGSATVSNIYGTSTPLYDDLFTTSTTSNTLPTTSTAWAYFGILSAFPFTAVGVQVTVEITLRLRFYAPNWLLV